MIALSKLLIFVKKRKPLEKRVLDNQAIQFKLAELQIEIESLRSLIYRACEEFVGGKDMTYLASMAKFKCGKLIREVSDSCLQYWGGMGFTWKTPYQRCIGMVV